MSYAGLCECGCGEPAPILTRNRRAQGHVVGRPARFISGHSSRGIRGPRYIEKDFGHATACWVWQGVPDGSNGYGRLRVEGRRTPAHRYFYERANGPVPNGLVLDHLCRTPLCVNPDHLEPVTIAENTRRGNLPVITLEDAEAIRREAAAFFAAHPLNTQGKPRRRFPQGVLGEMAERYGCSKTTIGNVIAGRAWTAK